jgi:hypothetical protein
VQKGRESAFEIKGTLAREVFAGPAANTIKVITFRTNIARIAAARAYSSIG